MYCESQIIKFLIRLHRMILYQYMVFCRFCYDQAILNLPYGPPEHVLIKALKALVGSLSLSVG